MKKAVLSLFLLLIGQSAHAALQNPVLHRYLAPELKNINFWMNSLPLQMEELKGKVVLVHFWSYASIDCREDLLYLNKWYQKYHAQGLVIIGIHSPSSSFEKAFYNVKHAVLQQNITFPVALDNQWKTSHLYYNYHAPARYLVDKNGYVVYQHFGKGAYGVTENNIRDLLTS